MSGGFLRGRSARRLALRIGLPAVGLIAAVALLLAVTGGPDAAGSDGASERATGTAEVTRRDLVESQSFSGTLGYDDTRAVGAGLSGTLTWIAGAGATRTRDQILYMVDESPVLLMYGTVPDYRDMAQGDRGRDVLQLERNLNALGHTADGDLTVDGEYDAATAQAVRAWQETHGLDETGTVERGRIVFLPGARRVSDVTATVGSNAGGNIMRTTSTRRAVTVDLDARQQDLLSPGDKVSVELPDGDTTGGRVTAVGTAATASADGGAPTIAVSVTVNGAAGAQLPDAAPVTILAERGRADGVLAVPVNALLALAGGGFGLERVDEGGGTTIVSAQVGVTADGLAEIEGPNVTEGMSVVVPG